MSPNRPESRQPAPGGSEMPTWATESPAVALSARATWGAALRESERLVRV